MAYELQKKTMEIELQEQEIKRKEKELDATIRRQADAKRYETETLAEAARMRVETEANGERARLERLAEGERARGMAAAAVAQAQGVAEAEVAKARGLAEAESRQAQGLAEALAMEKKAEAWQKYNEAAVLHLLAPVLPEIARAVAEPLSRIDRITMVSTGSGGDGQVSALTNEVARVMAQVPPVIESLTGFKLEQLISKVAAGRSALPGDVAPPSSTTPRQTD